MKVSKFFVRNFKIIAMTELCIIFCHALSLLITPYALGWKENHFLLATSKLAPSGCRVFTTSYHALSLLITPYPLGWKENHFLLTTLKLVPKLQIFHNILPRLVTHYHTLSTSLKRKLFSFGNFKISSQTAVFLTTSHALSLSATPYPLGWKENHFLATLKLVSRLQIFYHILSSLVAPSHVLSYFVP